MCNYFAPWLAAIGSILVAISAIWGEWLRNTFAGPKLSFLDDIKYDFNVTRSGNSVVYCIIKLINGRKWSPAKHVRIRCTSIQRKKDGEFSLEPVNVPVQLRWSDNLLDQIQIPDVNSEILCNIGYVTQGADRFCIPVHYMPNNFKGFVMSGETVRLSLVAEADNYCQNKPIVIEIFWNGQWSIVPEEMKAHLKVRLVDQS